jgi:hypothetical protein
VVDVFLDLLWFEEGRFVGFGGELDVLVWDRIILPVRSPYRTLC